MISWFRKKSKVESMRKQYQKLLQDAYLLSKTNRTASDQKYAEAQELNQRIGELERLEGEG